MTAEPDVTPRVGRAPATDLDEEREIDFGRLGRTVAKRWWLVLAAIVVGAVIGYLTSLGGGDAYVARTTIYLGQPLSPTGNAQIQSLATNPSTVSEIVRSDEVVKKVADEVGVKPGALRRGIATRQVVAAGTTAASRANTNPLVQISVRGPWKGDTTARAANMLADEVVTRVSEYVDVKAKALQERLTSENRQIAAIDGQLAELTGKAAGTGLSDTEKLIILNLVTDQEQRRGTLVDDRTDTETLLTLAKNVERGKQVTTAQASRVPAQSSKSAIIVGGFIGLLIGLALALLWEPVARRRRSA
jgi:uncharacterized protein involved in exopolysaccharide biosynthesis